MNISRKLLNEFRILALISVFCFSTNAYRVTSQITNNVNRIDSSLTNEVKTDQTQHANITTVETTPEISAEDSKIENNETEWQLLWRDDFDGPAGTLPSKDEWIFDIGYSYPGSVMYWGNNELQWYTNETDNVCTDGNGFLRITPLRDESGNWTSARIETKRMDFRPPEGGKMAIEARIQMPNVTGEAAQGYWPAFWSLGSPFRGNYSNWPEVGEFDIMENANGIDSVWGVLHCGVLPGGPCNETNGLSSNRPCLGSTCQSSFHTYRFEWDDSKTPKEFRWYVDGEQYHSISSDEIEETAFKKMTQHNGYFIILNVAIGGTFPNRFTDYNETPTDATEPGHSLVIDYVAVYTLKN